MVIILTMKKENSKACPKSDVNPTAAMIATTANIIGMEAETRVVKTIIKISRAIRIP